jgi:hypothetical protein
METRKIFFFSYLPSGFDSETEQYRFNMDYFLDSPIKRAFISSNSVYTSLIGYKNVTKLDCWHTVVKQNVNQRVNQQQYWNMLAYVNYRNYNLQVILGWK